MPKPGGKKVLLLCYSFSGQTRGIVQRLMAGLTESGVAVYRERLQPVRPLRFPIGSIAKTVAMMVVTLFRQRAGIASLSPACFASYDLIIVAGPTWSYNPSAPILELIHRDGDRLFCGRKVVPLISCRGYWRMHWFGLRRLLRRKGAVVPNCIVFSHPCREPWRTIGVFLKLAGKLPERSAFGRLYPAYGHSKAQQEEAYRFGVVLAAALQQGTSLQELDFRTPTAVP